MKEYEKLAREFLSEHDDGPEAMIQAYESGFLKCREMIVYFIIESDASFGEIPLIGEKEV